MLKSLILIYAHLLFALLAPKAFAQEASPLPLQGISYHQATVPINDPEHRCQLDIRLPEIPKTGFATLVWFHGGGFTGGKKNFPAYKGENIALIAAGYRLSPQVECPEFIRDAAAAIAWTLQNISKYGGDPKKVFIGGHSAGGYLTALVGMDPQWLAPYGLSPASIAGILPVSSQVTTHFQIKKARGNDGPALLPVIDEFAPLRYVSKDLPPICLILGDRKIEFKCRVEENELFYATLKNMGHPHAEFHEIKDLDHSTIVQGAADVMPIFIERFSKNIDAAR